MAAVLGTSSCMVPASGEAWNDTLVIGIESEPDILDPQGAGGWVTYRINHQMFEGLVGQDLSQPSAEAASTELKPLLAESWDISADGLTYTFHLREGVKFHDGTPFNGQAVDFNIRRMWDKDAAQYDVRAAGNTTFLWQFLEDITVVDDYTVALTMSQPFSPFLRLMAQGGTGAAVMMSPDAVEKYGDQIQNHPVGTGPFKFEDRVRGERVTLVRNDDYWGEEAELEKVVFRPIPDAAARVNSLRNEETDMIAVPTPDSIAKLEDDGFVITEAAPPHIWYLTANMNEEPMQDVRVRQAISMAIDREGMADGLLESTALPAYRNQAPANSAYLASADTPYKYDPEQAKQLLAEAGYPDGFSTVLETSVDGSGQMVPVQMAEYIQQNLAAIGIDVEIQTYEWISYISHYNEGLQDGVGMAQMSWGMSTPYWLGIVTNVNLIAPNGPNVGYYDNPEMQDAIDAAILATDDETATQLWADVNAIAIEDLPFIPIVNDKSPYVLSPRVEGFVLASEEWYDLTNVSLS
ncbi:MAG: ABC transporter substrate-binding protein [Cumulibacter sp.]